MVSSLKGVVCGLDHSGSQPFICVYITEFMRLNQEWGALEWLWLGLFWADMAVYKVSYMYFKARLRQTCSMCSLQCDHMQILTHKWHKVKEESKSSVSPSLH